MKKSLLGNDINIDLVCDTDLSRKHNNIKRNEFCCTDFDNNEKLSQQIVLGNTTKGNIYGIFYNENLHSSNLFCEMRETIRHDFTNYYLSRENLFYFGLGLMFHAAVSNTTIDQTFRNWYQDNIRYSGTNELSRTFKVFGEGAIWISAFGVTAGTYCIIKQFYKPCESFSLIGNYSTNVTRAYLVGAPTLILFQYMLGCSRPSDNKSYHSQWRFFSDNNSFSGHAFVGATPFLVLASMTDRFWLKFLLFACSTFAGLSRINDDSHYLSQVALGWYVSYLSVQSVTKTNNLLFARRYVDIKFFPILEPKYIGLGFMIKR
jgi:membrane-associated phospholipid phosphatase